jgi:GTP-binding protein HflX
VTELRRNDLSVRQERALLVGVLLPESEVDPRDPLAELASLARTAGARVVDCMLQKRSHPDPKTCIGKGKIEELRERVSRNDVNVVIFDNDLTPGQLREIELAADCKIVDRSELILDIFATRAKTSQARLQVELAQLEYTAPRLRGLWTHLERIAGAGGGTGAGIVGGIGTRGPGERQIEIDRRIVQRRVTALKRQLAEIDPRRVREVKARSDQFTVSLVGYANAGKSTLMNALTGANTLVEDKLFATLDTKTRQWNLGGNCVALLSDTVGFVRNLPHHLVASFRATLEEAIHARLLLHVVDCSSRNAELEMKSVNGVLAELGCADKPTLVLLNKVDAATDEAALQILERIAPNSIRISARTGAGLDAVAEWVRTEHRSERVRVTIRTGAGNGQLLAELTRAAEVLGRRYDDSHVELDVLIRSDRLDALTGRHESIEVRETDASPAPPASV